MHDNLAPKKATVCSCIARKLCLLFEAAYFPTAWADAHPVAQLLEQSYLIGLEQACAKAFDPVAHCTAASKFAGQKDSSRKHSQMCGAQAPYPASLIQIC
jgi:hypothetical protein